MPHAQIRKIFIYFEAKVTIRKRKYCERFETRKEAEEYLTSLLQPKE